MTPTKQTVFLPAKVMNEGENADLKSIVDGIPTPVLRGEEGYFFTQEQLNQFISDVIKDTLDTAAEKVDLIETDGDPDPKSITNTFDITYKKHKV